MRNDEMQAKNERGELVFNSTDCFSRKSSRIKDSALRLLTRRDHSRCELKHKLLAKDYSVEEVEEVLNILEQENWLSDRRFAESYVVMRSQRGYGPLRIQAELRERGVSDDIINHFIVISDPHWQVMLKHLCKKKKIKKLADDFVESAKQIRFLRYKGFTMDQIQSLKT